MAPPAQTHKTEASPTRHVRVRARRSRRRAVLILLLASASLAVAVGAWLGHAYVQLSRVIDTRLQDGLIRPQPRIFARPFELRRGLALTTGELVERLNDLGYTERPRVEHPGEFAVGPSAIAIMARGGPWNGQTVRAVFKREAPKTRPQRDATQLLALDVVGRGDVEAITVEPPLITALDSGNRQKRRRVPLHMIPAAVKEAVLAIEDRRFYRHPGVDIIRTAGAVMTNLFGDRPYLVGGSTLTQQLVKNSFLTPEKTLRRKLLEQAMAIILERRLSKDEILELYLNEVYLGQRGSFAIHGVAEASRMYFGKDVTNLSLAEAATIAGLIQAPPAYSPFRNPERSVERRNVVLQAMVEAGFLTGDAAARTAETPMETVRRALESEAPYFVDQVVTSLGDLGSVAGHDAMDVYTTLDTHLQRLAEVAVQEGLSQVEKQLPKKPSPREVQAALIAVAPKTGEVLALVGGRSYGQSQFNHVTAARRQPGSVFKPFVYLAAFEAAVDEGRTDLTPATVVDDSPTTFYYEDKEWTPRNYADEYDGPIPLRLALALSRNVAAVKLAETVGYGKVASLWKRVGAATPPQAVPSIALGVFEATPWEVAQAYTVFANGGELQPLRTVARISQDGTELPLPTSTARKRLARSDTTFLVTSMMRSVMDEGTGAGARAAGFKQTAAGKTGTTNDLRDAWFAGFTPDLLTVVWVGRDDNQALGLSGAQAALPIWTAFMKRALAGQPSTSFTPPTEGLVEVEIDRDTGLRAGPGCPRASLESFLVGSEPQEFCHLHQYD